MEIKDCFGGIYSGKRVMVTGHTGFKGAWLSIWLKELGAQVIGYALEPPTKPSVFAKALLGKRMISLIEDIRALGRLKQAVNKYRPQIIFHLAAQSLVRDSYIKPCYTYEVNCLGTANICEAARLNKRVKAVIAVTTDKVYANTGKKTGYKEDDPLAGFDPYSSTKACAELICASYRNSFALPVATCRAGNAIGAGDWAKDRLLPDCIRALSGGRNIWLRLPKAVRPWQYQLEPLYGYLLVGKNLLEGKTEFAQAWNFGPEARDLITVEQLVKLVIEFWGKGTYGFRRRDNLHEAGILTLDSSKAKKELGWRPKLDCREAVRFAVSGYREFLKSKDFYGNCVAMIQRYLEGK